MIESKHKKILLIIFSVTLLCLVTAVLKYNYKYFDESKIRKAIDSANYCTANDDCVLVESQCPFDCYVAVNKEKGNEISNLINNYKSSCVYGCVEVSGASCENNKCKVVIKPQSQMMEGYIKGVSTSPRTLEIDEIQFLSGEEAVQQVIKDTGCPREKVYECAPSMNNDFYISNPEKETKLYRVSNSAKLQIMINPGSPVLSGITFQEFADLYNSDQLLLKQLPFNFKLQNGEIIFVEEQYTP